MTTAGLGSWVAIAQEATWATTVARTRWFPLLASGDNLGAEKTKIESENIQDMSFDKNFLYPGRQTIKGSLEIEADYEGQLWLLSHAFHHIPSPSGPGPFTWIFTPPAVDEIIGKGLSIEILRGATQTNSFLYAGCKITKFTLTTVADGIAKINMEFLAQQVTSVAKTATPATMGDIKKIRTPTTQASQFCVIDSVNRNCKQMTFSYDQKYEPRFNGTDLFTLEPFISGKPEATLQLELEFQDTNEFLDFLAVTLVAITMIIEAAPTDTKLTIVGNAAAVQTGGVPFVNSMGIITYTPTYKLYSNPGTIREFTYTLLTDEATIS